jgi:hypothetical protein
MEYSTIWSGKYANKFTVQSYKQAYEVEGVGRKM